MDEVRLALLGNKAAQERLTERGELLPLARAESAEARCETLEKMLKEYQDVIVPGYRERAEKAERALAHMWYAYENKDGEFPHEYEKESVAQAEKILGKWEDVMQKALKGEKHG